MTSKLILVGLQGSAAGHIEFDASPTVSSCDISAVPEKYHTGIRKPNPNESADTGRHCDELG